MDIWNHESLDLSGLREVSANELKRFFDPGSTISDGMKLILYHKMPIISAY